MTFYFSKILFLFMLTNLFVFAEDIQKNREREAARSVIMRTVPSLAKAPEKLQLEIIEKGLRRNTEYPGKQRYSPLPGIL